MKINRNYSILLIPLFVLAITIVTLVSPRSYALEADDVANINNDLFPNNFNVDDNDSNDINNSGVMLLNNNEPSVSLTIGAAGSSNSVVVQPGSGTVYSNHTITIGTTNGENILNYSLSITAPASLSGSNGGTLTGAGGKAGNSMSDNTWGYYYNKDGTTSESNFGTSPFSSFTGTAQTLESGSGAPSTISKSLILAAKFGSSTTNDATGVEAGHYRGTINLSLVATPKTLYTYSITYNINGGTASSNPAKFTTTDYNDSLTTTISSTTPTRTNYTFLGWSKSNTATSASYSANGSITLNASNGREITLYAIWRRTFTLTLDANGGTGGPGTQTCYIYNAGTSCNITISSTQPTRTNYDFQGWGTSSTTTTVSYNPGDSITLNADKTIYAVWRSQLKTFTLNFDANGGSGAPAQQSCTTASADATSCYVTISTTMPTRSGYDFLGWSTTNPSNTTTATASTDYYPGKFITLSANSTTNLYAVWRTKVSTSSGFSTITNMQQMTSTICNSAIKGATKTLTDARTGNHTYAVTKLADGKCWMTQNLRIGSTTGTIPLTSSDSNVTSNYTLPQAITSGGFDDTKSGFYYTNQQVYIDSSILSIKGAYYSYNAATANSIATSSSGTASQDICPKNWRLPTKDEYVALASALGANNDPAGSAIIRGTPNNFVYTGYVYTGGLPSSSSGGYYWSSTYSLTSADDLQFSDSRLYPSNSSSRYRGNSVRCVAK